jgi:urea transport system ATP-binding protein
VSPAAKRASFGRVVCHRLARWTPPHGGILYVDDITVSFDGFRALNKLTLNIAPGELRCIIGPTAPAKPR